MFKNNIFFSFVAKNRLVWLFFIGILGLLIDQASKVWIQSNLAVPLDVNTLSLEDEEDFAYGKKIYYPIKIIEVVPNFFNLIYKENAAAAFSLTSSIPLWIRRPMLIGISVLATIFFLIWYMRMKASDGLLLSSFGFILSGALGNLLDRIRLGYVIDFLDMHLGFLGMPHLHWPTYNVADSLIVIGAIGVVIRTFFPYEDVLAEKT